MKLRGPGARAGLLFVLLLPTLAGSKCRKDKGDQDPDDGVVIAQQIDVELSVVSINPSAVDVDTPFQASVRGSGFERGANVWVGGTAANTTDYTDANTLRIDVGPMPEGRYDIEVVNPDGTASTLRQGLSVTFAAATCEAMTVYFSTDSSNLTSSSKSMLAGNLDCYRTTSNTIRVEGHCDERGTTDYNLALGERRAQSVSRYLKSEGIDAGRVSSVSFGEEVPAVQGGGESAWSKNRRAEIRVGR